MSLIHSFKIDGQQIAAFVDWQDSEVVAQFDDGAVQANLSVDQVRFVNDGAVAIRQWIAGGLTGATPGITEGPKFEMTVSDNQGQNFRVFFGCIDLMTEYKEENPTSVIVKLSRLQDKEALIERAKSVTNLLLFDENVITPSDWVSVPYVVEKQFNLSEFVSLSVTTFIMLDKLASIIKEFFKDGSITTSIAAVFPGGFSGALVWAILVAIANVAYAILIIIYIIDLIKDILEFFISPIRDFKGMNLKTMASKAAGYLGYNYETEIDELNGDNRVVFLPTKNHPAPLSQQFINLVTGQGVNALPENGITKSGDYGHSFDEVLDIINTLFRAKIKVDDQNNILYQNALINDQFWKKDANFTVPPVLNESVVYNTDDLIGRKLYRFDKDDVDLWTVQDLIGRSVEVVTTQNTFNDRRCSTIKGFQEIRFNTALGSRKDGLNPIEQAVKALAQVADSVVNFFGGNSNLAGAIANRVGMLRISDQQTTVPKLLYLDKNNKIPANHKSVLGAEALESKYYIEDSFVRVLTQGEPPRGQKQKFNDEGLEIPLGFTDFLNLIDNSYCTYRGQDAKIESLRYKIAKDRALIEGWTRTEYTKNLKEIFYKSDDPNL